MKKNKEELVERLKQGVYSIHQQIPGAPRPQKEFLLYARTLLEDASSALQEHVVQYSSMDSVVTPFICYALCVYNEDTREHVNFAVLCQENKTGKCLYRADIEGARQRGGAITEFPHTDFLRGYPEGYAKEAESLGAGGLSIIADRLVNVIQMRFLCAGIADSLEESFDRIARRTLPPYKERP